MAFERQEVTAQTFDGTEGRGLFDPVKRVAKTTTQVYVRSVLFHADVATDWTISIQDPEKPGNKIKLLESTAPETDAVMALFTYLPTSDSDRPDAFQLVFETSGAVNGFLTFDYGVEGT